MLIKDLLPAKKEQIGEILIISDPAFSKDHAINLMNHAHNIGKFIDGYQVWNVYNARELMVILFDNKTNDVCACAGFDSQQHIRSDLWTAKNAATFASYTGKNLIAKIYKFCKEHYQMTIQSDMFQSEGVKMIWTKGLQKLGLNPKVYDSQTHRTTDIEPSKVYGNSRYQWILEACNVYSNMYKEKSILLPYDTLYLNETNKEKPQNFKFRRTLPIEESKLLDKPTPTVGQLAEKYHTSLLAVKQQLAKGIKVEMEHTTKVKVAKEIALDHLDEDLYYYATLAKTEKNKK